MPNKNYYLQVLELAPGATKGEVKAAYRRLSKIYHPDISQDEQAQEKFIAVNEAYKFLTTVGPNPHQEAVSYDYDPKQEEYERWRQKARAYARRQAQEAIKRQNELIKMILYGFNFFAVLYISFNTVAGIDYLLPTEAHRQEIVAIQIGYRAGTYEKEQMYAKVEFDRYHMEFDMPYAMRLKYYESALVMTSPIFDKPTRAEITFYGEEGTYMEAFSQSFSSQTMYQYLIPWVGFLFIWYFLLAPLLDHKLTLAILSIFMAIVQCISFFFY